MRNKHSQRWSPRDEAFLIDNYERMGASKCAQRLGRTKDAVALRRYQIVHHKPKTVSQAMTSWWKRMFL